MIRIMPEYNELLNVVVVDALFILFLLPGKL